MKLPVVENEVQELQHNNDINEVINLLNPFVQYHGTQMVASYIISQLTRLKFMPANKLDAKKYKLMSTEELEDLRNKLDKWLNRDIAKSVVGGLQFSLIFQRALFIVHDSELINEPLIQVESEGEKIKTVSLNELFTLLRENEFLNKLTNITLRFGRDITESQLQFLIDCLIAYPVSFPITLNFSESNLGPKGSKLLSDYLKSGKTAKDLFLSLYDCGIDDEGARYLAEGIESGKTSEHLVLNLEGNRISDAGVKFLSDAIRSGLAKDKLALVLEDQANSEASAKHLAELICNPKAPSGLILSLCNLDDNVVKILSDALPVGKITNCDLDIRKISIIAQLYLVNSIDKTLS